MHTYRQHGFHIAAECESIATLDHMSTRMHAPTVSSAGACTAIFSYQATKKLIDRQKSDIKVLTSGPITDVYYTNQPA